MARHGRLLQQFARFPEAGAVKTRLQPYLTAQEACAVHETLLLGTARQLIESRLGEVELWLDRPGEHPTINAAEALGCSGPLMQVVGDLGRRMYAALAHGLARAERVVLVGSDCPELDPDYLRSAFEALKQADIVLGPAEDGGFVLIGARRLAPSMFDGVVWGAAETLSTTRTQLEQVGLHSVLLERRYDIDRPEDYERWQAALVPGDQAPPAE